MSYDPDKITFFAMTDARGQRTPFGIKAKDRARHVYVIGKTGMGKSTLLENMAAQDIQNGEGMAFIDPHGSAAETLLSYIPEHRIKDVLYFAPADADFPISFNIMEDVGPDKRHLVVSGLMSVFKKIWVDAWSARMEYILQNTLMALLEYPGSTLLGVNRMLSDAAYRKVVVENVKDPGVKSFWVDEFAKYNERYMQEAGDSIKNKIGQFTGNPIIRNIIGQPKSSFDIRQMMDEKKIIIMNLSKGLIGESNANLLGSMLTTRIYLAAMSRADLSPEQMKEMANFYFFVDEFQSFANATFSNILSEARKYKLNLTIAHQYIEQMEEEVRNAVFGNVGTTISFRVGPFDAEVLETVFSPQFLATDIVNLGFAQVYLTLMIDGIGSKPFSAITLPPIETPRVSYREMVIASSREKFARVRAEVEEMVIAFHEPVKKEEKPRDAERPRSTENAAPRTTEHQRTERGASVDERPRRSESGELRREERREAAPERRVEAPRNGGERSDRQNGGHGAGQHQQHERTVNPGSAGNNREERNTGERSKPAASKEKNLDDLRSVLRTIVRADEGGEQKAAKPSHHTDAANGPKKDELRAALGSVLGVDATSPPPRTELPHESVPVADSIPKAASAPPSYEMGKKEDVSLPSVAANAEETVSAKELERMMRITTSDTTPFK